ncbi:MAG: hypothetical protein LBF16_03385 [Pseudomonadales bacterium]|jgi:hypothetical protein|nr:hypothetical protein [Pseudomonadales bacterium]
MAGGDRAVQRITDFDALYRQAEESKPVFDEAMNAYLAALRNRYPGKLDDVSFQTADLKKKKYAASGGKPMPDFDDLKPNDRLHHCEYYLMGNRIPVAFLVSHDGNRYGARRPGDKPGSLVPDATLISKLERDEVDFTPLGEEEFRQHVRDYVRLPPVKDGRGR